MKRALPLILALVICLVLCACGEDSGSANNATTKPADTEPAGTVHVHQWTDATCEAAKTCTACGTTEGEKLGHQWKRDTCTDPYTCTVCKATNGEGDEHRIEGETCTDCKKPLAEIEKEPAYQYQKALKLLNSYYTTNEEVAEAHKLLSGLGNYKDAATYLSLITKIPDVRLYWIYEARNAFGEITDTIQANYRYNASGALIAEPIAEYYNGVTAGGLVQMGVEKTYVYDDQGRKIQYGSFSMDYGDSTTFYKYDGTGKLVETKVLRGSTTYSLTNHFYDDKGQEIRLERLYADGKKTVITYTYDGAGNCIQAESVTDGGTPAITYYERNAAGLVTCIRQGSQEYNYQYDADGNLVLYSYLKAQWGADRYMAYVHFTWIDGKQTSTKYSYDAFPGDTAQEYVTNYVYGDYYVYTPAK